MEGNKLPHRRQYNLAGHAHELTFSCYQRFQFLRAERTCQWLADAIERARYRWHFDLWAYVFMPEHVHLIVLPRGESYEIQRVLTGIKLPVARRAINWLASTNSPWLERVTRVRGSRTERLFWQSGGGYDRNITETKTLLRMIDYVHLNPVRRGLAEHARQWRWSSAASYEGGQSPLAVDRIPAEWLIEG